MADKMNILHAMNVHNEEDIVKYNIGWYASQGIPSVVIDNGSTDGTRAILESLVGNEVLEIKDVKTDHFDRDLLFSEIGGLIHKHSPDWVVFSDADEFLQPQDEAGSLRELIEANAAQGANTIQFHNIEFWMTPQDDAAIANPVDRIKHYSYFDSNRYKAFKFYPGFSLVSHRGHAPTFPQGTDTTLASEKGVMRHYKFRSLAQAYYKIKRVVPEPGKKDFGFHYLKLTDDSVNFIIDPSKLTRYDNDGKWLLERKFDGNRMSNSELMVYLGLSDEAALNAWFKARAGV